MNRPISTSFSPNFQKDDVRLSMRLIGSLVTGKTDTTTLDKVRARIAQVVNQSSLQPQNVALFSSARAGLFYSLKALNLQEGDEVIIQAFTCVAVPASVVWAGLTPVFVDIDKKTYNIDIEDLSKKITNKTRVIIVQHTFGIPAPIKEILKIASEKNIYVIEDCAHVFGGTLNGKVLGTFGDIGVFSFGRDKALSSVFGGAVIAKDKNLSARLTSYEKSLIQPPLWFVLQQLFYPVLYNIALPVYDLLGKAILWAAARVGFLSKAVQKTEHAGGKPTFLHYSFHPALAALLLQQLDKASLFNQHRKNVSNQYIHRLGLGLLNEIPYLRVPLYVENKGAFLKKAQKKGVHLGNWYRAAIDPPNSLTGPFNYKSCLVAEDLAAHTVNLPTHINTSQQDVETILSLCQTAQ